MQEGNIREELAIRCQTRGGQSQIAEDIGVGKSTVGRWLEGSEITPSHMKLLRLYFYGEIPFDDIRPTQDLTNILKFSAKEWEVINVLATRSGKNVGEWIASQIREYLAFLKNRENPPAKITQIALPEIPLLHAAAGSPIVSDVDTWSPSHDLGHGRFACQLHGDSMAPRFPDGSIVIIRERDSLKTPVLKRGEIYLFEIGGEKNFKVWSSREATPDEIEHGLSYVSPRDGKTKVHTLESLNPDYPEIVVEDEPTWIGWLDPEDI